MVTFTLPRAPEKSMPLDLNGCNAAKAFADFAQQSVNANDAKAIAGATFQKPFGGHGSGHHEVARRLRP